MGVSNKREAHLRLATEDQPLIQPSEVLVNVLPVHTAQPIVTPIGKYSYQLHKNMFTYACYTHTLVLPIH